MTQDQIDIFNVNTQSELGLQGHKLVKMIENGDMSVQAYAGTHMALHGIMFATKDYDIDNECLSQADLKTLEQKGLNLIASCNTYV